ncbi:MAG TPA: hypothetical protein VJS68_03190 [Thermoplasmata archaeon]|nr:hypothetical protein [Thermoplasmata archaeon]
MPAPVIVRTGRLLHLVRPDGLARSTSLAPSLEECVSWAAHPIPRKVPPGLLHLLAEEPAGGLVSSDDPEIRQVLEREGGLSPETLTLRSRRTARETATHSGGIADREFILALAKTRVQALLADPFETLVSLAREEERLERSIRREADAASQFVAGQPSGAEPYLRGSEAFRRELERHHERLLIDLERLAERLLPNLSQVVGGRVAGRLAAAAGGAPLLSRMTAARIQLLGTRRRPPGRLGPRYGLIYRAVGMDSIPVSGQGAYARSLAALAAVAVRADVLTHGRISSGLVTRRDRRIEQLRRQRQ